jgi:sec-independent protein translocase protein TatC
MDRLKRSPDDLFDNSVMTFGEHLEELRHSLVRAVIWLAVGTCVGVFLADSVILYIQRPLEAAIRDYYSRRDLAKLDFDPNAPDVQPLRELLMKNSLVAELVYEIPEQYQSLPEVPPSDADGVASPISAVDMKDLIQGLPDIATLKPKVQLRQNQIGLSSLQVEEPFMIWFKASLVVGAIIASPMVFYHLWTFVAAGLHAHERRYVYVYLPLSIGLFSSGVALAFYVVMKYVLDFLLKFNASLDVAVEPRLTYYVNFVLILPLGFGIAFQLPLVMLFLQRIDLFQTEQYMSSWRMAVFVIFVISMLVTPSDATSMVLLAVPLCFLYVMGILLCKYMPRGRGLGSDAYDPA